GAWERGGEDDARDHCLLKYPGPSLAFSKMSLRTSRMSPGSLLLMAKNASPSSLPTVSCNGSFSPSTAISIFNASLLTSNPCASDGFVLWATNFVAFRVDSSFRKLLSLPASSLNPFGASTTQSEPSLSRFTSSTSG